MERHPQILASLPVETSHGTFTAHYSELGLAQLDFPREQMISKTEIVSPSKSDSHFIQVKSWHVITLEALQRALQNQPIKSWPPLDLSAGTEFQQRVWNELRGIQAGQPISYGELASRLGQPGAVRAVGRACGANPIPVLIPCHRVLAANGKIGGFSGGLNWKKRLLKIEAPRELRFT